MNFQNVKFVEALRRYANKLKIIINYPHFPQKPIVVRFKKNDTSDEMNIAEFQTPILANQMLPCSTVKMQRIFNFSGGKTVLR